MSFLPGDPLPGHEGTHVPRELTLCGVALAAWIATRTAYFDRIAQVSLFLVAGLSLALVSSGSVAVSVQQWAVLVAGIAVFSLARKARGDLVGDAVAMTLGVLAAVVCFEVTWRTQATGQEPAAGLGQRNHLAHVLFAGLPLATRGLRNRSDVRLKVVLGACVVVIVMAILHTRCRSAWLAVLVFSGLVTVFDSRRDVLALVALGVLAGLSLPSRLAWKEPAPLRATAGRLVDPKSSSGMGRLARWADSLALVEATPVLGIGPGRWRAEYPRVSRRSESTWNRENWQSTGRVLNGDFAALLIETGVVGLLGLLLLGTAVLFAAIKRRRADLLAAVLGFGVIATFDAALQLPATAFVFALVTGLLLPPPQDSRCDVQVRPLARLAVAIALCFGMVEAASRLLSLSVRRSKAPLTARARVAFWVPGDPSGLFEVVEALVLDGRCAEARPLMGRLEQQLGHFDQVRELLIICPPEKTP